MNTPPKCQRFFSYKSVNVLKKKQVMWVVVTKSIWWIITLKIHSTRPVSQRLCTSAEGWASRSRSRSQGKSELSSLVHGNLGHHRQHPVHWQPSGITHTQDVCLALRSWIQAGRREGSFPQQPELDLAAPGSAWLGNAATPSKQKIRVNGPILAAPAKRRGLQDSYSGLRRSQMLKCCVSLASRRLQLPTVAKGAYGF